VSPSPKKIAAARGRQLIDYLLDVLAKSDGPLTSEELSHFRFTSDTFGVGEAIDKILEPFSDKPAMRKEI